MYDMKFNHKPSEEIYDIEFKGKFIPNKFHPTWFEANGLLGEEEALKAEVNEAEEGKKISFSTTLLNVFVDEEIFRISSTQLLALDSVFDMAISVAELLKDSIESKFSLNLKFHFPLKNKKDFLETLNNIGWNSGWKDILAKPQVNIFQINDEIIERDKILTRAIWIYPCPRENLKNTIHLYIFNTFEIKDDKLSVWDIVKDDSKTFEKSLEITNKIIDTYFSKS